MREFTIDDLLRILREAAGEDETVDMTGDISEVSITSLGYDSLAMLETAARVEREFGVFLDDETVATVSTPGALVRLINDSIRQTV